MIRKFLNARSPMRLMEEGLHGGLGIGNVGLVLAGHGVGKTSFLVGVALDELLRGGTVLHVSLDQTVAHVHAYYDTLYETLAASTHLEDAAATHAEIDHNRSIRAYPPLGFSPSKLRQAVKVDSEAGTRPSLVVLEGLDVAQMDGDEVMDIRALADEIAAEVWLSAPIADEKADGVPKNLQHIEAAVSVILALEPARAGRETVVLRALKDHDNDDLSALHVALDPKSLLLVRN